MYHCPRASRLAASNVFYIEKRLTSMFYVERVLLSPPGQVGKVELIALYIILCYIISKGFISGSKLVKGLSLGVN